MLNFAGVDLPSYVKVNGIKYSVLAPIEHKTAKIQGRKGRYDFGIEEDMKTIEVDYQLIGVNESDVMNKAADFATWLYHKDLQPLMIDDQPDRYYMARVIGDTDVTEEFRVGSGSITFAVPSGVAEDKTISSITHSITSTEPVAITNDGTAEAYPIITLTMREPSEVIGIYTDDEFIQVGDYPSVEKETVQRSSTVLYDNCRTFSGWSAGLNVDGGSITGTFASDGEVLVQSSKNYGTGSTWHGAAAVKSLSRSVQDFQIQARSIFDIYKTDEIGRVEIYLYGENNEVLGKFAMKKPSKLTKAAYLEARAGSLQNGKYFVNSRGKYDSRKKKYEYYDVAWFHFSLARQGNKWRFYYADLLVNTGTTKHYNPKVFTYTDTQYKYMGKLAKIQIHVGAYGTNTAINRQGLSDIRVVELNALEDKNVIDLNTGDVLVIDNERGLVTKNGISYFTGLNPASRFFPLDVGTNGIIVDPPIADMQVDFRKRYL